MHVIARELNLELEKEFPVVLSLLSEKAKRFFYPKGILAQSAEANTKSKAFNATIGVSTSHEQPMFLESMQKHLPDLAPKDLYLYAPVAGRPKLRELWRQKLLKDSPSLGRILSLPFATSGITHALSLAGQLFLNPGDKVLLPDLYWENYNLLFENDLGAELVTFPFFNEQNGFNQAALDKKIDELAVGKGKVIMIFNFPNNPTGYSLLKLEQDALVKSLLAKATQGIKLVVLCDDAYFGLFFDNRIANESLFARLAGLHPNIFAIKADGATKEFFVWGFRIGFLSFAYHTSANQLPANLYTVLEKKLSGLIRAQISNPAHPPQTLLEKVMEEHDYAEKTDKWLPILAKRWEKTLQILTQPKFAAEFIAYPCNSGYFLSIKLHQPKAEKVRLHLLNKYATGTIALDADKLRIAFSSIEEENLPKLFDNILSACQETTP